MEAHGFSGRGFSFPVETDWRTGVFQAAEEEESIRQSIHLILMTKKGERITKPQFGCGIWDQVFGTTDFPSLSKMEQEVEAALVRFEPRICGLEVRARMGDQAQMVEMEISYRVRTTNNPFNLVYPFYLEEGVEII